MELVSSLRRRWWLVALALVVLVLLFGSRLATFYTDVVWFRSIGFVEVFWQVLLTRFGLGVVAGLVVAVLVAGNLLLARRLAPPYRIPSPQEQVVERYRQAVQPHTRLLTVVAALLAAVVSGSAVVGQWQTYLLWRHGGEFERIDPQFGLDLGFFVFDLPFLVAVERWLFASLAAVIVLTALGHYLYGGIRPQAIGRKITASANVHVSVLLAVLVAVRAWGFWLDRYLLSYSPRGRVTGLSYTDVHAQLRAYELLTVIALVCVLLFLVNVRYRGWFLPAAGVGILVVAGVILAGIYPALIQRFQVDPQELPRERPFIERNLDLTRFGYRLDEDNVTYERFAAASDLTTEEVVSNGPTLDAIRLWDPATLQNTYQQLQELRPYYDFRDVDVDRYDIEGRRQQVMLSVRGLNELDLPSPTWQNRRITFTHGYGIVASRVSTASPDGQPDFLASNIPVQAVEGLEVDQPRIYFGEGLPEYSIIGTTEEEFDYETEAGQELYRYTGEDGVRVGGLLRRLSFALRYAEPNILLSSLLDADSRILFNRDVADRVSAIAPFLQLDHDPYPAVVDGRIVWIIDAYTTTDMVPYSQRLNLAEVTRFEETRTVAVRRQDGTVGLQEQIIQGSGLRGSANYIRNSVKAVVDAYDGTIRLYVTEPDDPLVQAWDRAFPGVLTPLDDPDDGASDDLLAHFRYPEDLLRVQSELLRTYHIQAVDAFYTQSDAWRIPQDVAFFANEGSNANRQRSFPPTYQVLRLPQEETEEFALIQPFTPVEREVLSAYAAARWDPDTRGRIRILQMPPTETVFGPEQVQARIDQDPRVSEQITLWDRSGSSVIYGNLIVVPIEDSLLYAQPLFLRAEQSQIPELRRVVLVFGDQVIMEERLAPALERLFGDLPAVVADEPAAADDPDDPLPGDDGVDDAPSAPALDDPLVRDLVQQAIEAFAAAEEALQEGDLGTYQERTQEAQDLVQELEALVGDDAGEDSGDASETQAPSR